MKRARVYVEAGPEAAGRRAASLVDAAVRANPESVLILPTGATPIPLYAELVRLHRETGTSWAGVTTFNLDEYAGVSPEDEQSYARFMARHFFDALDPPPARRLLPDGLATDLLAETLRYEAALDAAGGADVAVLGLGLNGHIGFNEPAPGLTAGTHVAALALDTWRRNFPELAATHPGPPDAHAPFSRAITLGVASILQARRIVLVATGASKRDAVHAALHGPITTAFPASLLQLHRDVTVILDGAAAPGGALAGDATDPGSAG